VTFSRAQTAPSLDQSQRHKLARLHARSQGLPRGPLRPLSRMPRLLVALALARGDGRLRAPTFWCSTTGDQSSSTPNSAATCLRSSGIATMPVRPSSPAGCRSSAGTRSSPIQLLPTPVGCRLEVPPNSRPADDCGPPNHHQPQELGVSRCFAGTQSGTLRDLKCVDRSGQAATDWRQFETDRGTPPARLCEPAWQGQGHPNW